MELASGRRFAEATQIHAQPALGQVLSVSNGACHCRLSGDMQAARDTAHVGAHLKIPVDGRWLVAMVYAVRPADGRSLDLEAGFLGEAEADAQGGLQSFVRGISRYPAPDEPIYAVSREELALVYGAGRAKTIDVGAVHPTHDVRARLKIDSLLAKHFAILGSSGTGKSTTTALVLHRLLDQLPHAHILMLDPHGEYKRAFGARGHALDVSTLELPYWTMNLQEHCEVLVSRDDDSPVQADILARCLLTARSKSRAALDAGRVMVDSPVPYLMSDLLAALQSMMGKLDKPEKAAPFLKLKARIEELKSDPRYAFMFSGMLVSDSFVEVLNRFFRLRDDGKPIAIVDLSGVPSDIVKLVVGVLCRLAFDFAQWSMNVGRPPLVIVCEEAHRYVPALHLDENNVTRGILERIAKEGRKYGVCLGLVSQRPSDLSESVLSQCGTVLSMRMNNERDQNFVRAAMPEGGKIFLDAIAALRNRECIVSGEGVAVPMRVALDTLEPERRPTSDDPIFTETWSQPAQLDDELIEIIRRWRSQSRE